VDNLQKYHIVSKTITDWATNVVLIKKQSPPAEKAMEQTLLDQMLDKKTIPELGHETGCSNPRSYG